MRFSEFDRIETAELTRPANTTGYSTGQVIGSANLNQLLTFKNAFRDPNATGFIRSIRLLTNQPGCQAVISVWLYNAIPTVIADGSAFQNYWVERSMCLGHFAMSALTQFGSSDYALSEQWFTQYNIISCGPTVPCLYAQLVTGTGFTPASGQVFRAELGIHQNEYA